MSKSLYVYPDVGRTGLCNMLFPWARAVLFAKKKGCKILAPRWTKLMRIGPWMRGERDKRYYSNQFTNAGYIKGRAKLAVFLHCLNTVYFEDDNLDTIDRGLVVFKGLGSHFSEIAKESEFLKHELYRIAAPQILDGLERLPRRFIGVHIRCGDFVSTGQNMSNEYYLRGIEVARSMAGVQLPVCVFSDANPGELDWIKQDGNIRLMKPAPALQDVLSLARSEILVGTNISSFSEWASFLGGMTTLWNKDGRLPSSGLNAEFV